jgi:predicted TIM-barrel fold metal-dependent hydrolase
MHFLTAEVREAWNAIRLEAPDPSVAFHSGAIERRLIDLAGERLALMDESGLDVQVLSLTTPALHDPGSQAIDMAQRINDAAAKAIARHPDRFQALASRSSKSNLLRTLVAISSSGIKSDILGVPSFVPKWRRGRDSNPRFHYGLLINH